MSAYRYSSSIGGAGKTAFGNINNKEIVYIPHGAEKGDCPYCTHGVLFWDSDYDQTLGVKEVYQCDTCSRRYIEGINIRDWYNYTSVSPRRSFIGIHNLNLG